MSIDRDAYEILQVHPRAHQQVIQAAYRVLAALYHPDGEASSADTRRMAELNAAYAKVRTHDLRQGYDRERRLQRPSQAASAPPRASHGAPIDDEAAAGRPLDFGRYEGWTVAQIARRDPDYLRWLSRHSAGARFRTEIDAELRSRARARK
jgi:curved DNA-binding protein CbpA